MRTKFQRLLEGEGDIDIDPEGEIVTHLVDGRPVAKERLSDFRKKHVRCGDRLAAFDAKRGSILPPERQSKLSH